jgi:hypothetical protein
MACGLGFSTLCLLVRYVRGTLELFTSHSQISFIYRVIELAYGWGGRIISTELYFG